MKPSLLLRTLRTIAAIVLFGLITACLVGFGGTFPRCAAWLARIQLMPAAMAFAMTIFVSWMIATLIFGRIYCSTICPLGVFQDIAARLPRLGKKKWGNAYHYRLPMPVMRYATLAVVLVTLMTGFAVVAVFIDPYSIYGRFCSSVLGPLVGCGLDASTLQDAGWWEDAPVVVASASMLGALVAVVMMIGVAWLAWLHGRLYCNTICPVGTTLGIVSQYSIFHIDIDTDKCIQCRKCEQVCKSECIDLTDHVVDGSRCVVCFDCITVCPNDAIRYTYLRHQLALPMFQKIGDMETGTVGMGDCHTENQCHADTEKGNTSNHLKTPNRILNRANE